MFDSAALCRILFEELGFPADAEFAVAYSGGCDSQVLLHALWTAGRARDFGVRALHFDHGLAPQSADWARQCAAVCREWGIPFASARCAAGRGGGESVEALARRHRYRWFARAVEPGQVLLTAHHADDQAETLLLNLLRGGGVESLAGIARRRALSAAQSTQVARPLLDFPRAELAEYARQHGLTWIEDPANQSAQFDRNYIRNTVIPRLTQRWPGAIGSLGGSAQHCRDAAEFLDGIIRRRYADCRAAEKRGVFCLAPPLDAEALRSSGRFEIFAVIRHWLHRHGRRSPSAGQLATLHRQVFETHSASAALRWNSTELRFFRGHLYLTGRLDDTPGDPMEWNLQTRDLGKNRIRVEVHEAIGGLDPELLRGKSLRLVWRTGGERMTLPGRTHSNALKKLFQQNAVPPWERRALPLLVVDGEIAWAHGIGAGAGFCRGPDGGGAKKGIGIRFAAMGDAG